MGELILVKRDVAIAARLLQRNAISFYL